MIPGIDSPQGAPKMLDLFSGIGGFALAFEAAGFETVAFSEIEPYPCKILAQHWPNVPNLGDVRGINGERYRGAVDVVCGGFPCQDISLAGKGAGIDGARSGLWSEMLRIIRGSRPRFCLLENVPALKTRGGDRVLGDLEAAGYTGRAFVVGAVHAGANHRRLRTWIVAYANENGLQAGLPLRPRADDLGASGVGEDVAYSKPSGWHGRAGALREGWGPESSDGGSMGHPDSQGLEVGELREPRECPPFVRASWWESEPGMGRVATRIPNRAHRIKALGNSIVPAVAYPFACWIKAQLAEAKV